jgi:SAM-dependent methyltransferase
MAHPLAGNGGRVTPSPAIVARLRTPPGLPALPELTSDGWHAGSGRPAAPYLSYLGDDGPLGWSADLEALHERAAREHPIDVLTRRAAVSAMRGAAFGPRPTLLDVGCSGGHLLADLRSEWPGADLVGVDAEAAGLARAGQAAPGAVILHASATDLPLGDGCVDGLVALNLLEHLATDVAALREFARVLRPGGRAVVVVPANRRLYDYYDAHLRHERRYERGELADKARAVDLEPRAGTHLGFVAYPAFSIVKRRHRRFGRDLADDDARRRVERDIARSGSSALVRTAFRFEEALLRRGLRPRFGIREALVLERRR